jgi:hypothetical protein
MQCYNIAFCGVFPRYVNPTFPLANRQGGMEQRIMTPQTPDIDQRLPVTVLVRISRRRQDDFAQSMS